MVRIYRLEFNEVKQKFHLSNYVYPENTHGWITIFEHCSDLEFKIYESYVNRIPRRKLTKLYLQKCAKEVQGMLNNLLEYGLDTQYPVENKNIRQINLEHYGTD